ncbi:hypothetical protein G7046_g3714 [Stylonectria norvegica]|nr:hypothetical protein G7046_g3714 [Stylonectria norvegica]
MASMQHCTRRWRAPIKYRYLSTMPHDEERPPTGRSDDTVWDAIAAEAHGRIHGHHGQHYKPMTHRRRDAQRTAGLSPLLPRSHPSTHFRRLPRARAGSRGLAWTRVDGHRIPSITTPGSNAQTGTCLEGGATRAKETRQPAADLQIPLRLSLPCHDGLALPRHSQWGIPGAIPQCQNELGFTRCCRLGPTPFVDFAFHGVARPGESHAMLSGSPSAAKTSQWRPSRLEFHVRGTPYLHLPQRLTAGLAGLRNGADLMVSLPRRRAWVRSASAPLQFVDATAHLPSLTGLWAALQTPPVLVNGRSNHQPTHRVSAAETLAFVMPLHQRTSANTSKRATMGQPGSFYEHDRHVPHTPADRAHAVQDYDDRVLDDLNKANTELNKSNAENDKLKTALELANRKLNETAVAYRELKAQMDGVKTERDILKDDIRQLNVDNQGLNVENQRLEFERRDAEQRFIGINAKYENLTLRFNALEGITPPSAMSAALPDRPKPSSRTSSTKSGSSKTPSSKTSSKKEHRDERHRDDRHRDRGDREERHRERSRPPRENKERKEHKERDMGKTEALADKERLSKRFGERPAPANRRASFIEPWGPGGRSSSALPADNVMTYTNLATGRMQAGGVTPSHQAAYANVPRTAAVVNNPGHFSSDSSAFDDDAFEDGSYHPYPIVN